MYVGAACHLFVSINSTLSKTPGGALETECGTPMDGYPRKLERNVAIAVQSPHTRSVSCLIYVQFLVFLTFGSCTTSDHSVCFIMVLDFVSIQIIIFHPIILKSSSYVSS